MDNEIMKDIEGFKDNYSISNRGRLWSKKKNKFLKPSIGRYKTITLYDKKKTLNTSIHRLVALAFVANIDCKSEVNHKDGDKLNNEFYNLEWVTTSENNIHAFKLGLRKPSEKQREFARIHAKTLCEKTSKQVNQLSKKGKFIMKFKSIREASRVMGTSHQSILRAIKKNGNSSGFKWEVA